MISSDLAWTFLTTSNQIWKNQWVARRKEGTWRVLEQLKYSWKRGHVHRERLKQAILGLPPCSLTHIQSCIIHTLHYLCSSIRVHHSRAQFYSFHQGFWIHGLMSFADGWELWGGWESQAELSHRRKWLQRLLSLHFSSVWLCCSWVKLSLQQDEMKAWTGCNAIRILH